jgi:hypothetical protein
MHLLPDGIWVPSQDENLARCRLKDLYIQSEIFVNTENGQKTKMRWWGLTHEGRGTTSLIAGVIIAKPTVKA